MTRPTTADLVALAERHWARFVTVSENGGVFAGINRPTGSPANNTVLRCDLNPDPAPHSEGWQCYHRYMSPDARERWQNLQISTSTTTDRWGIQTTVTVTQTAPDLFTSVTSTFVPHAPENSRTSQPSTVRLTEGVLRWTCNDAILMADVVRDHGFASVPGYDADRHLAAYRAELDVFLGDYRRRMANHKPSDEELFEMRAAFGAGTKVVNVITGVETRL